MNRCKHARYKPLLALILLSLGGCMTGPDFFRPQTALPDEFTASVPTIQAQAPLQKEWWLLFQDAQLNELIAKAQAHNHDLLAAIASPVVIGPSIARTYPVRYTSS